MHDMNIKQCQKFAAPPNKLNPGCLDAQDVTAVIERKVEQMIKDTAQRSGAGQDEASTGRMLPLIRLRVDYTGFSTINAQRFGQKFVGRVANPHDMLLFHKAVARKAKACHQALHILLSVY